MKNKKLTVLAMALGLSVLSSIPAFASGWQKDNAGWWYATNDNNSEWYHSGWQWIDGNNDGIAECYYFNPTGYIFVNGVVDNYTVNADGAWTVNGVVQTKQVSLPDSSNNEAASSEKQTETTSNNDYYSSDEFLQKQLEEAINRMGAYGDPGSNQGDRSIDGGAVRWE